MIRWIEEKFTIVLLFVTGFMITPDLIKAEGEINYTAAENILEFGYHLYETGDYGRAAGEFLRYRYLFPEKNPDLVQLMIGMAYRKEGVFDRSIQTLKRVSSLNPPVYAMSRYETALAFFFKHQFRDGFTVLSQTLPDVSEEYSVPVISALGYSLYGDWERAMEISESIDSALGREIFRLAGNGLTAETKSPAAAGILSAIIPGLGKMYADRWKDGFFSLLTVGILGGLAAYNFAVEGINSVKGWVYGGLGVLFHFSNIYGAVTAAIDFNIFQKKRLEEEIFELINSRY